MKMTLLNWIILALTLFAIPAQVKCAELDIAAQLAEKIPGDFPHFEFAGHQAEAQLLTHYLWRHFHHRAGNWLVLVNKEYMLTSDMWLGNACPRNSVQTIQDLHR